MLNNILYICKKRWLRFFFRNCDEAANLRFQILISRHINWTQTLVLFHPSESFIKNCKLLKTLVIYIWVCMYILYLCLYLLTYKVSKWGTREKSIAYLRLSSISHYINDINKLSCVRLKIQMERNHKIKMTVVHKVPNVKYV